MKVAVISYGMGNVRSVMNAFEALNAAPYIAQVPEKVRDADAIVLPGVGAFADGIKNLIRDDWVETLEQEIRGKGKPFLGICLGMQLLASVGTEHGLHEGLGLIPGRVERFDDLGNTLRIPHIGWNEVSFAENSRLYAGMGSPKDFYFLHSYTFIPENKKAVSGICSYGGEFAASIESGNIFATQFHPEKSHKAGLAVLKNFLGFLH